MKLNSREQELIHDGLNETLRQVISGGIEIMAVHRLKTIINIHAPDQAGYCVACDLPHPCRTYRVAYGERV